MPARRYYVYIMASKPHGVLYIGMTDDIARRVDEHKRSLDPFSFTALYHIKRLVYVETFFRPSDAIAREKAMKYWKRAWKINLIETSNPAWADLTGTLH